MPTNQGRPYSGRLIFDHFPKTAGQSINHWLTAVLGSGTVSPNLHMTHGDLISYGAKFPVLTGHIHFIDGERLEPRYQYATILREPIDRTLSSLFFVIHNHQREQVPKLFDECDAFIASEGERIGPQLRDSIVNPMVKHFARILGARGLSGRDLVDQAFRSICEYHCIGVYEHLGEFVANLAALIGIPVPTALQSRNVTSSRPAVANISQKLLSNLQGVTELDLDFYSRVAELVDHRLANNPSRPPKTSKWRTYESPPRSPLTTSALSLQSVRLYPGEYVCRGAFVRFEIEFELHEPVGSLQAGLHIFDETGRWAFGSNNRLLGQAFENIGKGRHRLIQTVTTDLPTGNYAVGFSFADLSGGTERTLLWQDELLWIEVSRQPGSVGVGYSNCYVQMVVQRDWERS